MGVLHFSLVQIVWLAGCSEKSFEPIERERNFIASLNIQEPSLDFIDEQGNVIATWLFEKPILGRYCSEMIVCYYMVIN